MARNSNRYPYQMTKVNIEPVYQSFKGWNQDISKLSEAASLPEAMKYYVDHINQYLGVKVSYISNGPGRDQIIPAL